MTVRLHPGNLEDQLQKEEEEEEVVEVEEVVEEVEEVVEVVAEEGADVEMNIKHPQSVLVVNLLIECPKSL